MRPAGHLLGSGRVPAARGFAPATAMIVAAMSVAAVDRALAKVPLPADGEPGQEPAGGIQTLAARAPTELFRRAGREMLEADLADIAEVFVKRHLSILTRGSGRLEIMGKMWLKGGSDSRPRSSDG